MIENWHIDSTWSLFLDRDGVINERDWGGYITSVDDFHFIEGAVDAISQFTDLFKYIFVVTNQQGLGKGLMSARNLDEIHTYMNNQIKLDGGEITKVYFADNLRDSENDRRKPLPAMALEAKDDFPDLNFNKCIMVGDTDSDILFGKNLGMKTIRLITKEKNSVPADLELASLKSFSEILSK